MKWDREGEFPCIANSNVNWLDHCDNTYHKLWDTTETIFRRKYIDIIGVKVKVKLLSRVRPFATPWTPGSSVHGVF